MVVILGILAAIVVPQFVSAASESRENSLKMDLYRIRQQIGIYKEQHAGQYPDQDSFEQQMTLASNRNGATAPIGTDGYGLGPYLREIPINPFTGTKTIGNGAIGSSAWYYDASSGEFRANNTEEHAAY